MARGNNVLEIVINGTNRAGPALRQVGIQAMRMGAVVSAAFIGAAHRAGQLEKGLAEISTLLDGDTTPAIERMRGELLDLSVAYGQSVGKMTKARYDVISAGFIDAADSAVVLQAASKLAVAGVSDVASTADLLTTAINGMGAEAKDANRIADVLFQTVRKGKTTMDQLAQSMGPLFATAKVAGVEIQELGAVMATLTAKGINTAESVTAFNQLMLALAAPTGEAKDALEELGVTLDDGAVPALIALAQVGEDGLDALAKLIPNIRALKAAAAAGADVGTLNANLRSMHEAVGVVDDGVRKMSETMHFKLTQARAAWDGLVMTIGEFLLPHFTRMAQKATEVAVVLRYLTETVREGTPLWKEYAKVIKEEIVDSFYEVGGLFGWVRDRLVEMHEAVESKKFNSEVTEVMRHLMTLEDTFDAFKKKDLFNRDIWDLYKLRKYAEQVVRAKQAAGSGEEAEDTFFSRMSEILKTIHGELENVKRMTTAVKSEAIEDIGIPDPRPRGKRRDVLAEEEQIARQHAAKMAQIAAERVESIKAEVASLAQFTAEDFIGMAFNIGSAFANVATEITGHLFGLTKGPLMLGRAFKAMTMGILSDLAQIIGRMLVARALMSAFGGGGFLGGAFNQLGGFGGQGVATAATGYTVPHNSGGYFPPVILPGAPGMDRTPVLASGGEMIIPRERVNMMETVLRRVQTSPRRMDAAGGGRKAKIDLNVQANRPFRREEQIVLRDSVVEGITRAKRHGS